VRDLPAFARAHEVQVLVVDGRVDGRGGCVVVDVVNPDVERPVGAVLRSFALARELEHALFRGDLEPVGGAPLYEVRRERPRHALCAGANQALEVAGGGGAVRGEAGLPRSHGVGHYPRLRRARQRRTVTSTATPMDATVITPAEANWMTVSSTGTPATCPSIT